MLSFSQLSSSLRPLWLTVTLFSSASFAQTIYKWEDASGTHYADSMSAVPKSARNVETMRVVRDAPAPAPTPVPSPAPTVVVHNSNGQVWEDSAGLNESQWRDRFIKANRKIQTLEAQLAAADANPLTVCPPPVVQNGAIVQPAAAGGRCVLPNEYEQHRARIAQQKIDLVDARADLEQLERLASEQGVPREWRRGW